MSTPSLPTAASARALAALLALLVPCGAGAGNLLANPGFDSGLQPWRVDFPQVHFAGPDAGFDLDSGSMQIDLAIADPLGALFTGRQCVAVAAGATYDAEARAALLGPDHPRARVLLELAWHADAACAGTPLAVERLAEADDRYQFWLALAGRATAPPGAAAASLRLGLEKLEPAGDYPVYALFDDAFLGAAGDCVADATTLCLRDGRFAVTTAWSSGGGAGGAGFASPLTSDTGLFWFFDAANVEVVVKVLDGCALNERYWVYAGGLTDLGVTLNVTDTLTGATASYENPLGTPWLTVTDVGALAGCP
jgi:hypothetical protein